MKQNSYFNNLSERTSVSKFILLVLVISLVVNLLLAIKVVLTMDRVRTIVAPPSVNQTFWVDDTGVSKEYLNQMALFFVQLNFNVTPANVDYQHTQILKYTSASGYSQLDRDLRTTANNIKQTNVATWFAPTYVGSDEKSKTTVVDGEFVVTQGTNVIQREQKSVQIQFAFEGGKISVVSMKDLGAKDSNTSAVVQDKASDTTNPTTNNGSTANPPQQEVQPNTPKGNE